MKKHNICSLVLNSFKGKIEKVATWTGFEPVPQFPTFAGEVDLLSFILYKTRFTLAYHLQRDEKEFVAKLFLGYTPKNYFENDPKKKLFSRKAYRQNDPFILKLIYHDPVDQKESWIESQLPLHSPGIDNITKAVEKVQNLFFQAEKKARKKF